MPKAITVFESDDGQRFESLAACEQYEANNRSIYLQKLRDEIGYREVPLFDERKYGAYVVPPVTILTATPRNMSELETIAEIMRNEISDSLSIMPGFRRDPDTMKAQYAGPATFPMVYSVMIERYRRRKNPTVKLFSGYEFKRLANLCTGHLPPESDGAKPDVGIAPYSTASYKSVAKANSRHAKMISYNGETKTMSEWAKSTGIERKVINARLYNGWTPERALTTPVKHRHRRGIHI